VKLNPVNSLHVSDNVNLLRWTGSRSACMECRDFSTCRWRLLLFFLTYSRLRPYRSDDVGPIRRLYIISIKSTTKLACLFSLYMPRVLELNMSLSALHLQNLRSICRTFATRLQNICDTSAWEPHICRASRPRILCKCCAQRGMLLLDPSVS
jgi:hypothetical protein